MAFHKAITMQAHLRITADLLERLKTVVFARYPELKHIKQRLRRAGAEPVAMTGSGSAIFGIFADEEKADRAKKSFPDKTVFPISFVSRAKYRSAWRRALHLHAEGTLWPPRSLHNRNPYAQ